MNLTIAAGRKYALAADTVRNVLIWSLALVTPFPPVLCCRFDIGARAENGLDETRTDALMPQPETGKISCVHHPRYGRLPPDACINQREAW
jgi:hypothetical protein